ncbi:MAG TPA: glycerol-3-phosphate dehydrogenase/oxidase [Chloroflexota bacterium]|nr:glycerol-3-phosphate dehydrogenase/oxidase [Chloroflexota bacterium]
MTDTLRLDRSSALAQLGEVYDVLIIGGGATGLGAAVDSATRGYRTLLITSGDFAQATSSRSTKLIHGGVRYLERGDIALVRESLHERGLLRRNAPHLVRDLRFLIPAYQWWQFGYYGGGLKIYDLLAGRLNLAPSGLAGRPGAIQLVPTIRTAGLKGGITYSDGQFNDARLAITLAHTARAHGAALVNYAAVTGFQKSGGRITSALVVDEESGREHTVRARTVINAAGIFADCVRRLDDPETAPILTFSRGSHLVLDRRFLPGETALLIPRTADGRVLFVIPWEGRTMVGTTDVPADRPEPEPEPSEDEIAFLLDHVSRYLDCVPHRDDVLSTFAGLRPLVRGKTASTARLSRDHTLLVSSSGLVTITGGKWTTYRRMAQDAVGRAAQVAGLPARRCLTESLRLHGADGANPGWREFGATDGEIAEYERRYPGELHPRLPYSLAMAAFVVDREMPVHLDDVLARRLRAAPLDARASLAAAPAVARLMARLQGHGERWASEEVERFTKLAAKYGATGR